MKELSDDSNEVQRERQAEENESVSKLNSKLGAFWKNQLERIKQSAEGNAA